MLPRWRVSLGYEFVNRAWLLGGVDDILSSSRRDYFVGMQLRFNDEDLKSILPFAPKAQVYNLHRALVALRRTKGFHHVVLIRTGAHG